MDLGPVTVVRETTKGQVIHRLRGQRKVPGYLMEGSVPLTKTVRRRLQSFLKEKNGLWLKILEVVESELIKLKLQLLTMALIELLTEGKLW